MIVSVEDKINEILEELGYKSKGPGDEDEGDKVNLTLVMIALVDLSERIKTAKRFKHVKYEMDESDSFDSAIKRMAQQSSKIKEQFIETWMAVNIRPEDLTKEIFNELCIVQEALPDGSLRFSVEFKDQVK